MTVTKVLGNQTGIQHQGVQDKSEADPRDALLNVVFTGNFKRGRMDRPFKVTPHDYRAKLGHDPENQAYSAIEDALTDGAPFVWVQRVGANASGSHKIDILPDLQYSDPESEQSIWWTLEIDNEFVTGNINDDSEGEYLEEYLKSNSSTLGITGEYTDSPSKITLTNLTKNRKFVRLIPSIPYKSEMLFSGNGTVSVGSDGTISFWLEANEDATELPEVVYRLTIDDKGLLPSDNIYSGNIEPPLPGIVLGFNIQQYIPNGSNGRVFNIYSDPTGLQVSEDGAAWWVDKATISSSWDFPVESDFTTPATYELMVSEFFGNGPTVTPGSLEYVVEKNEPILGELVDNYYPINTESLAFTGEANGLIPFSVPNGMDNRISVNVNSKDILGTMPEVMDVLMTEYQIAVSYMSDGSLLFTCNNEGNMRIAVSGTGIGLVDSEFSHLNGQINTAYDPVTNMGVYTFTLTKKYNGRMFSPALHSHFAPDIHLQNDSLHAFTVADSAAKAVSGNHLMTNISLVNLVDIKGNAIAIDAPIKIPRWKQVPEVDRTNMSYGNALSQVGIINKYYYKGLIMEIFYSTMAKAINDAVSADQPFIHWLPMTEVYSSGVYMFAEASSKSYFFDFGVTKENAENARKIAYGLATLVKGYLPYYTGYYNGFPGYEYFTNVEYYD